VAAEAAADREEREEREGAQEGKRHHGSTVMWDCLRWVGACNWVLRARLLRHARLKRLVLIERDVHSPQLEGGARKLRLIYVSHARARLVGSLPTLLVVVGRISRSPRGGLAVGMVQHLLRGASSLTAVSDPCAT
jgi:hypothetical protein